MKLISIVAAMSLAACSGTPSENSLPQEFDDSSDDSHESVKQVPVETGEGFGLRNGNPDSLNLYPAVVKIIVNGSTRCTGTVVTNKRILTAAHCVEGASAADIDAQVGSSTVSPTVVHIHPEYNNSAFSVAFFPAIELFSSIPSVDLAVLEFQSNLGVSPLGIDNATLGQHTAVGYGEIATGVLPSDRRTGVVDLKEFYFATNDITTPALLNKFYASVLITTPAGNDNITCPGDSGGPLINAFGKIIGVAHGGGSNCDTSESSVYVATYKFRNFITGDYGDYLNPRHQNDVNDDGLITSSDVLGIINFLNSHGPGPLTGTFTNFYPDTNHDGNITSQDVLNVINEANSGHTNGVTLYGHDLQGNYYQGPSPENMAESLDEHFDFYQHWTPYLLWSGVKWFKGDSSGYSTFGIYGITSDGRLVGYKNGLNFPTIAKFPTSYYADPSLLVFAHTP